MTLTEIAQALLPYWPIMFVAIGGYAWLIRLEMRSIQNSKDIKENSLRTEKEMKELEARLATQRAEDIAVRKERDDRWDRVLDGIQTDIKELLQRTAKD